MEALLKLLGGYIKEIEPIHYFIVIALLLLFLPFIYRYIKGLYQERLESSADLVNIKTEIATSLGEQLEAQKQQMLDLKSELKKQKSVKEKYKKILFLIAVEIDSLRDNKLKLDRLEELKEKYISERINLILLAYSKRIVYDKYGKITFVFLL